MDDGLSNKDAKGKAATKAVTRFYYKTRQQFALADLLRLGRTVTYFPSKELAERVSQVK